MSFLEIVFQSLDTFNSIHDNVLHIDKRENLMFINQMRFDFLLNKIVARKGTFQRNSKRHFFKSKFLRMFKNFEDFKDNVFISTLSSFTNLS